MLSNIYVHLRNIVLYIITIIYNYNDSFTALSAVVVIGPRKSWQLYKSPSSPKTTPVPMAQNWDDRRLLRFIVDLELVVMISLCISATVWPLWIFSPTSRLWQSLCNSSIDVTEWWTRWSCAMRSACCRAKPSNRGHLVKCAVLLLFVCIMLRAWTMSSQVSSSKSSASCSGLRIKASSCCSGMVINDDECCCCWRERFRRWRRFKEDERTTVGDCEEDNTKGAWYCASCGCAKITDMVVDLVTSYMEEARWLMMKVLCSLILWHHFKQTSIVCL